MDGRDKGLARDRLVQKIRTAQLTGFAAGFVGFLRGDIYHRKLDVIPNKLPAQIKSGHAAELDIGHQTADPARRPIPKKFLGGMIDDHIEAGSTQQPANGAGKAFIVVHHRNLDSDFTQVG